MHDAESPLAASWRKRPRVKSESRRLAPRRIPGNAGLRRGLPAAPDAFASHSSWRRRSRRNARLGSLKTADGLGSGGHANPQALDAPREPGTRTWSVIAASSLPTTGPGWPFP